MLVFVTLFFVIAGAKEGTAVIGETGLAGTVCLGRLVGEGGRIRHCSAATFPKGGDGMIGLAQRGARIGGGR